MILIPQYRTARRASASAAPVELIESKSATGVTSSVTFTATPSDGQMIVLVFTGRQALTGPAGFTTLVHENTTVGRSVAIYYKVAASEGSATYTCTSADTLLSLAGYVLSACTAGDSDKNATASSVTTFAAGAAAADVSAGAFVVAAWQFSGSTAAQSVDGGLGLYINTGRALSAYLENASAGTINSTASWTTARAVGAAIGVFNP